VAEEREKKKKKDMLTRRCRWGRGWRREVSTTDGAVESELVRV